MAELADLYVILRADTAAFKASMADASIASDSFGAGIAKVAIVGATAVAGLAVGALDLANKFDTSTAQMASNANITIGQAQQIGNAFLDTAGKSEFSANTIMEAFAPVAGQMEIVNGSALDAAQATQFMATASQLAEASGTDLKTTTTQLAQVMQASKIQLSGASDAASELFNASRLTNTPIDTLVQTVDRMTGKLGPLGGGLENTSALLVDLESHGETNARSLTLVSSGLDHLTGGTKAVNAEISSLGLNLYDQNGQFVGMQSIIAQLQPALAGMSEQQRLAAENALFGTGASKALDATIMAGVPGWNQAAGAINNHNAVAQGAAEHEDTLGAALDRAKGAVVDMGIRIGQALEGPLKELLNWFASEIGPAVGALSDVLNNNVGPALTSFSGWFEDNVLPILEEAVDIIMKDVVPAMEWLWTSVIAKLMPAFVDLAGALDHLTAAVLPYLGDAFQILFRIIQTVWNQVGPVVMDAIHVVTDIINAFADLLTGKWGALWQNLLNLLTAGWSLIVDALKGLVTLLADAGLAIITALWTGITNGWNLVTTFFHNVPGWIVDALVAGTQKLVTLGGQIIGWIGQGITGAISDLWKFITDLPDELLKAVSGIADKLANVGTQIIQNIAKGITGAAGQLASSVVNAVGGTSFVKSGAGSTIGHATGTQAFAGGWTLVGERGPEMVNLPAGSNITPSVNMPTNFGGDYGSGQNMQISVGAINVQGSTDPRATAIAIRNELLNLARGSGVYTQFGQYA